jgi:hypothetical protein
MPGQVSHTPDSSKTKLEIVVNWRMIALAVALAVLPIAVLAVGFLCFSGQKAEPTERPVVAESARPTPPARRAESPRVRFDPATVPSLVPPAPPPAKSCEPVVPPDAVPNPLPYFKTMVVTQAESPKRSAADQTNPDAPALAPPRKFKHLNRLSESESIRQLSDMPELDLDDTVKKSLMRQPVSSPSKEAKAADLKQEAAHAHALLDLAAKRQNLQELPLRGANECQKKEEAARAMQRLSRHFRRL